MEHAKQLIEEEASLVANEDFRHMCLNILQRNCFPFTKDGCLAAYGLLVQQITEAMNTHGIQTPTFAEANVYTFLQHV